MRKYNKLEILEILDKNEVNKEHLAAIFRKCPQPMSIISTDAYFVKPNEALCNFLEYSFSELQNKTFYDITHPEDLTNELKEIERLLDNDIDHFVLFKRYISKGGRIAPALLTLFKVDDEEGNIMYYISHIVPVKNGAENNIKKWVFEHSTNPNTNFKEKAGIWMVENWKFVFSFLLILVGIIYVAIDFRTIFLNNYEIQKELLEKIDQLRK